MAIPVSAMSSRKELPIFSGRSASADASSAILAVMKPAKQTVRALLDQLPDDCSLEDVVYHLYVIQKVEAGLADAEAGKLIPHEQVAEELRRKWVKGAA